MLPNMRNNKEPLVSVCIPVYNRKDMLRRSLISVARQTLGNIEIIVVDNCSEDDLEEVVKEINDLRIRYYRNTRNIGAVKNFIKAASLARGKYLKFLCSDDVLFPTCLEESIAELEAYPQASALFFKTVYCKDDDISQPRSYLLPRKGHVNRLKYAKNENVFGFHSVGPTVMLIKTSDYWNLGGLDNTLCAATDWELYYRLLQTDEGIVFYDKVLSISFDHSTNESLVHSAGVGFLQDVLMLRSRGVPGKSISYANNIWRNISQSIRTGKSVVPVIKLVRQYGYLTHFIVMLPALFLMHAWSRISIYLPNQNEKALPDILSVEKDEELQLVIKQTRTDCNRWKQKE